MGPARKENTMQRITEGPHSNDLTRYVQGLEFPALKHDAVHAFRQNGAPDEVVAQLQMVPVTEFVDLNNLIQAYEDARIVEQSPREAGFRADVGTRA
jgi:hypothetical protein